MVKEDDCTNRPSGSGASDALLESAAELSNHASKLADVIKPAADHAVRGVKVVGVESMEQLQRVTDSLTQYASRTLITAPPPLDLHLVPLPDYKLEALEEVTRLLAESQEAQRLQAEEHARREAEHNAREERALELAEKSHAEAVESKLETRRARKLAAWSLAMAVLALIAAVAVPLIVG